MVNLYYKYNKLPYKKRHTLQSLGVGFAFFGFLYVITKYFQVPICLVKTLFGISCPGCGLMRGFIAILHFDLKQAMEYNVMSIPLFICILLYTIFAFVDVFSESNFVEKIEMQLAKRYMYCVYIVILLVSYILNNI